MGKAGVDYRIIRDKYLENDEFRKEYEKLGEEKMGLLIKESQEKAKVLFITHSQYEVMESCLELMEFEDGTYIEVLNSEKSIYVNTCGLDITIMSPEVDIELISRKFNYIFVDVELNYGLDMYEKLRKMVEFVGTYKFINCGIYVIGMYESDTMCRDLFEAFGGEEVFDYGFDDDWEDEWEDEWENEDYEYDEYDNDEYYYYDEDGLMCYGSYEDEYEEDEAPYKVERQED